MRSPKAILSLMLPVVILALPLTRTNGVWDHTVLLQGREDGCVRSGNADFYGFGVRLGIYLQISSTLAALAAVPEFVDDFQTDNTILLLAILIALIKSTPHRGIRTVDVIILLQIMFCIIICGFSLPHLARDARTMFRPGSLIRKYSTMWSLFLRLALPGPIVVYNIWLWFSGMDYLGVDPSCPPYIFFFAKLDALGRIRTFYKFASVVLGICLGIPSALVWLPHLILPGGLPVGLIFYLVILDYLGSRYTRAKPENDKAIKIRNPRKSTAVQRAHRGFSQWRRELAGSVKQSLFDIYRFWEYHRTSRDALQGHASAPIDWAPPATLKLPTHKHSDDVFSKRWETFYLLTVALFFSFSVLSIELTIHWNEIEDAYSIGETAQLIAFVIGIASAMRVGMRVIQVFEDLLFIRLGSWVHRERTEKFLNQPALLARSQPCISAPDVLLHKQDSEGVRVLSVVPLRHIKSGRVLTFTGVNSAEKTTLKRRRSWTGDG